MQSPSSEVLLVQLRLTMRRIVIAPVPSNPAPVILNSRGIRAKFAQT
jgi:hypothetical protein